jgi:hypothetical protein
VQKAVNLFDELVADLKKENLLDGGLNENSEYSNNLTAPVFHKTETDFTQKVKEIPPIQKPSITIQPLAEITPDKITEIKAASTNTNAISESGDLNYNPVLLLHPVKKAAQPKVEIKPKQKGRFCQTCLISVPYHRFSCKFCGERVTGKFVYYPLIILFTIILVAIFLIIVASKNYT